MNKTHYVRVTAPGLPTFPALWFDAQQKQACVCVRLATWRSYARAYRTTMLLRWTLNGLLVWLLWERLPFREAPFGQGFLTFVGYGFFAMFTKAVFHPTLDRFWARQIYPIRTRFWFSPDAIAFQSRLYDQGILLWRPWRDQPVQARFDLTTDLEAASLKASYHKPDAQSNPLWQTAHLLRITISSTHPQQTSPLTGQPQLIRALPILEIDLRDAQALTVVLTAAATLTAPQPDRERIEHQGLDLDTHSAR